MTERFYAFVDESGSAGGAANGNQFFTLGAVVIKGGSLNYSSAVLDDIRRATGRRAGDELHFKNLKIKKGHRLKAAQRLCDPHLLFASVSSHKGAYDGRTAWTHDDTYLWTITLLMERLSWICQQFDGTVDVTLAHKRHMTADKLAWHEQRLRAGRGASNGHSINWVNFPRGLKFSTPKDEERLQIADMFVSSVGAALNGEGLHREVNTDYVKAIRPQIFHGTTGKVGTYGLKIHPSASIPTWAAKM